MRRVSGKLTFFLQIKARPGPFSTVFHTADAATETVFYYRARVSVGPSEGAPYIAA